MAEPEEHAQIEWGELVSRRSGRSYYRTFTKNGEEFELYDGAQLLIGGAHNMFSTGDRGERCWAAKLVSIWRDDRTQRRGGVTQGRNVHRTHEHDDLQHTVR